MIISYFGKQFFKVSQGDLVLATNPVSKSSKSGITSHFGSDIALITTNHPDYNGVENLSFGEKSPFVIEGPGDYEIKGIFIKGGMTNAEIGGKKYINTVYSFTLDGIKVAFLGTVTSVDMAKEAREAVEEPDILFVPVGSIIDPKIAAKIASGLSPKLIIPMDYDSATLKAFLKEVGEENPEKLDKLTLKRKDLEGKEGKVIVLQYS